MIYLLCFSVVFHANSNHPARHGFPHLTTPLGLSFHIYILPSPANLGVYVVPTGLLVVCGSLEVSI